MGSKKSSCCVPSSIPSPAKYRHVQVIIQSGREERVFQPRHRARISHDLRQISRLSRGETKVRSRTTITRNRHAGREQWAHTGPVDPLENSNGTSWPRLCEPRRYHRILRILFTAGVWMRAHLSHGVSHGTLSRVTREF